MPGIAIVSPLSFSDTSLPRVDISPIPSIRGALYDWAVDTLTPGDRVTAWTDRASHVPLLAPAAPSQAPVVVDDPTHGKVLRFNGGNQRIDASNLSLSGPRTLVVVGRLPRAAANDYFMTDPSSSGYFNLGINGDRKWIFYNGAGLTNTRTPNSSLHVFMVVINGNNSVVAVDGEENGGSLQNSNGNTIRIGASGSAYFPVDLKRLVILPYAASAYERTAIHSSLAERYL